MDEPTLLSWVQSVQSRVHLPRVVGRLQIQEVPKQFRSAAVCGCPVLDFVGFRRARDGGGVVHVRCGRLIKMP